MSKISVVGIDIANLFFRSVSGWLMAPLLETKNITSEILTVLHLD